jgi:hypothetical protein
VYAVSAVRRYTGKPVYRAAQRLLTVALIQ